MTTNAPPSRDPADLGDLAGMIRQVLGKFLQGVDDCLPARVLTYDRTTNRAQVQPLVMMLATNDQVVGRAAVASVPVLVMGAGGYVLSFPVKPGDLGWIKANDRDISLFLQGYKEAAPNTLRLHSFSDAVFIPDAMRGYALDAEDAEAVVLQSLDGSAVVSLSADRVKVKHPTKVVVDAPLAQFTGDVQVDGSLNVTGEITGEAGLAVATFVSWAAGLATGSASGDIATPGTVAATGDVVGAGISLSGHVHSGVTTGAGNTGGPT